MTVSPTAGDLTGPLDDGHHQWVPHNRWDMAVASVARPVAEPVAIIIPYYEQPDSLCRMYAALTLTGLTADRCELLIVDDGSAAPPPPPPDDFPYATRFLHQPDLGCRPCAARNLGAATTSADILVFLDPDTLPAPGTIERLAAWPATVPDAVVVGRRGHVDLDGWSSAATQAWLRGSGPPPPRRRDPTWLQQGYDDTGDLLHADDRSYRYVISAVMACHRWLYDDVGGFDATRVEYGGDDWEFASRAFNNGAVLVHDPEAVAWHDEPDWSERDGARATKNLETLWLARAIPEPATRGQHLLQQHADTIVCVTCPHDATNGQVVATVHSLLAAIGDVAVHLPLDVPAASAAHVAHDPRVHLGPPTAAALARARTVVDLHQPAVWDPAGLRTALAAVRPGGPGQISIECRGVTQAVVTSTRAEARVRRAASRGIDPDVAMDRLFGRARCESVAAGLKTLPGEIDLAGFFAGWSSP